MQMDTNDSIGEELAKWLANGWRKIEMLEKLHQQLARHPALQLQMGESSERPLTDGRSSRRRTIWRHIS